MKNIKFLIALSLTIALVPAMNFASYRGYSSGSQSYPPQTYYAPQPVQPIYQAPYLPATPTPKAPSTLSTGYFGKYWENLRNQAASAASYIPGYDRLVKSGWLKDIKDYGATRLFATLGTVLYGLAKAGINYQTIFEKFFDVAGKIWGKTTVANAVIAGLTTLGISAVITDISSK